MTSIVLKVARDFSKNPGPRNKKAGRNSGEALRELLIKYLKDAIKNNYLLVVDLDGTSGYAATFLEEVFGGLCREEIFTPLEILGYLSIVSEEEPELIDDIHQYIGDALGWPNFIDVYFPNARDRT
jgi:hypothetical protein